VLLAGRRIILTGVASGIAAATLSAYAAAGADVVGLDIDDDNGLNNVQRAAESASGRVSYRHCDITDRGEVFEVVASAVSDLGGVDVLAHVAGTAQQRAPEDVTEQDLDAVLGVHVKGTVFLNQAAFQAMRDSGGAIINFGSQAGVVGSLWSPAYGAAKGGVLAWTRSIARSWGRYGIRANAVCPMILTPMATAHQDALSGDERARLDAYLKAAIPLGGTYGDPDRDLAR
jgi:3-oxoacyl-[acyl-carrier protein] reductase